jgi:hypothetical protein
MTAYLAEVLAADPAARDREDGGPEASLDLLRNALNNYGYQYLGRADAERVQAAYDDGDEEAFCRMAGPAVLLKYLDEFLGDFLVRKVLFADDEISAIVEDVRAFVAWLRDRGAITPAAARKSLGRLAGASVDLPAAERLSEILYRLSDQARRRGRPAAPPAYDEVVEDYLVVERVAPGRIWFLDRVGPIKVPDEASALARPGWTINLVLGRRGDQCDVLEVGSVYPETLA